MPDYTITLGDIDAYLATKQEQDVVGVPASCTHCLVANALGHKYGGDWVVSDSYFCRFQEQATQYPLSEGLQDIVARFDDFTGAVTKNQWIRSLYGH